MTSWFSSLRTLGVVLFHAEERKDIQSPRSKVIRPHFKSFNVARVCIRPELPPT